MHGNKNRLGKNGVFGPEDESIMLNWTVTRTAQRYYGTAISIMSVNGHKFV